MEINPDHLPPAMRAIWDRWRAEEEELRQQMLQDQLEEERAEKKMVDARRNRDFADAVDKVSRAGYVGKHGQFPVPDEEKWKMESWRLQAQNGDYDSSKDNGFVSAKIIEKWKTLKGIGEIDAKRKYINLTNELITQYGWNPPPGWS